MIDYATYRPDSVLFERNPVCGVCWRVCMDMCEEWGGPIQFDLLASMEAADRLCQRLINNTWTLRGIEYYYHWLEAQLGFSRAAITCATATVCLSLRLMDDAPSPHNKPCMSAPICCKGSGASSINRNDRQTVAVAQVIAARENPNCASNQW